jgi:glutamate/tyrosine decarboxylase-like PLP-dependent enzyme
MNYLGEDGYLRLTTTLWETTGKIRAGIDAIPELHLWGEPDLTLLAFGSETVDIMAVGDVMDDKGWCLDRQQNPSALHLMISPNHHKVADQFLADLGDAVNRHGASRGKEARYS